MRSPEEPKELNGKLMSAVRDLELDAVVWLIGQGADVNFNYGYSWTPLMWACFRGSLEIVKYLIEKGADINKTDNYGNSAWFLAFQEGHTKVAKYLVEKGANVNQLGVYGCTPFMEASRGKDGLVNSTARTI